MAKLFTLMYGRSKKNMKPIMTDLKHKCENYMKARSATLGVNGHHSIVEAEPGATPWRINTTSQWTNYDYSGPAKVPKKKKK